MRPPTIGTHSVGQLGSHCHPFAVQFVEKAW